MTGTRRLVSCLMVTKPGRFHFVKQSVAAYCAQTYPERELVILLDIPKAGEDIAIAAHIAELGRRDIRLVIVPERLPLGALRNRSRTEARGSIICQWDDDDLHHPTRLDAQVSAMETTGRSACYLTDVYQYSSITRELFWTNWAKTPGQAHPGTLLAEAAALPDYPESGLTASLGEDLAVLTQVQSVGDVYALAGSPHLLVYVTHGENSWPMSHHRLLVTKLALSRALLLRRESQVRAGLAAFDFGPGDVIVSGANGPAFSLGPQIGRQL